MKQNNAHSGAEIDWFIDFSVLLQDIEIELGLSITYNSVFCWIHVAV